MATHRASIEYTCDWVSSNGDDQRGQIHVRPIGERAGWLHAFWSCTGGMGDGAELKENTTDIWTDEEAELIVDSVEICQGIGTYEADIGFDENNNVTVENIIWPKEQQ